MTLLWGPNGAGKTNLLEARLRWRSGPLVPDAQRAGDDRVRRASRPGGGRGEGRRRATRLPLVARRGWRAAPPRRRESRRRRSMRASSGACDLHSRSPGALQGPAGRRRDHLDALLAALWPGRARLARLRPRARPAQRALGRVRAGAAPPDSLDAWDRELARGRHRADRSPAGRGRGAGRGVPCRRGRARASGRRGRARVPCRAPRRPIPPAGGRAAGLAARPTSPAGHTTHGPHLDELDVSLGGRSLRRYRLAGRAANRAARAAVRRAPSPARRAPSAAADAPRRRDERARPGVAGSCSRSGSRRAAARRSSRPPSRTSSRAAARAPSSRRRGDGDPSRASRRERRAPTPRSRHERGAASPARRRGPARVRGRTEPPTLLAAVQGAWASPPGRGGARGRAGRGARRRGHGRVPIRDLGPGARPAPDRALEAAQRDPRGARCRTRSTPPVAAAPVHGRRAPGDAFKRDLQVIRDNSRAFPGTLSWYPLCSLNERPEPPERPLWPRPGRSGFLMTPASGKD